MSVGAGGAVEFLACSEVLGAVDKVVGDGFICLAAAGAERGVCLADAV
jgi:hypothetical protein